MKLSKSFYYSIYIDKSRRLLNNMNINFSQKQQKTGLKSLHNYVLPYLHRFSSVTMSPSSGVICFNSFNRLLATSSCPWEINAAICALT